MRIGVLTLAATIFLGLACFAGEAPTSGTIVSEKSVDCGSKNNGKKSSTAIVCQQYLVRTATTEYEVRQPKPSEQAIIPANSAIEFTLDKDKMKFKLNGRKYEFLIVGTSGITAQ
jgi:hypothetical protein